MLAEGSVLRVGSVTGDFQSEAPLHPAARAFLVDAFERGWANPEKRHNVSRRAAILLNEAKETFAGHLGIRREQIEILSDPALGFHLGTAGLRSDGSTLFYPATSRSELLAEAQHPLAQKIPVDLSGSVIYPTASAEDLLVWQTVNGETGIISSVPSQFLGRVFVDATASGSLVSLPDRWHSALWSSRAWQGPAGVGIFALADRSAWRNPLPHLDQRVSTLDFSVPLTIASAIALDAFAQEYVSRRGVLLSLNERIRNFLLNEVGQVDIAGTSATTLPHLLSFSLLYIDAEALLAELDRAGFAVDSGSACNSANLEPSHVLAAMGLLTHGNIRLTLHNQTTQESVDGFLRTLKVLVDAARA